MHDLSERTNKKSAMGLSLPHRYSFISTIFDILFVVGKVSNLVLCVKSENFEKKFLENELKLAAYYPLLRIPCAIPLMEKTRASFLIFFTSLSSSPMSRNSFSNSACKQLIGSR